MIMNDKEIKKCVDAFVPPMTESYTKMVSDTVSKLKASNTVRSKREVKIWRPLSAAAAILVVLFITSAAVFGARPALAAEVPGVSSIVYAVSPQKAVTESDLERIEALLNDTFRSLAFCDYEAASGCFRGGSISERGNYLSAAYLNYLVAFGDFFPDCANAARIEIEDLQAEQKAFRYTAHVTLNLISRDGTKKNTEDCTVQLWENTKGLFIENIGFSSTEYESFVSMYETFFGTVPNHGASLDLIPLDTAYLSYVSVIAKQEGAKQRVDRMERILAELDSVNASSDEKTIRTALINTELGKAEAEITPDVISVEQLASELMYRYWLGGKTGEACDFTDIMEKNEDTDLFFWDAILEAEKVKLGAIDPLISVEFGTAQILEVIEDTDELIKARFYVYTEIADGISQGVGEEIILTIRKDGNGLMIIGFDRDAGDGFYTYSLKPLASKYKKAGYSWQEAGRMAYDTLHVQIIRDAEWLSNH